MTRLMSICIMACVALGCDGGADVSDAGTDVLEGPCADQAGVFYEVCADDHERVITIYADCATTDVTTYCYWGCDAEGTRCVVYP
jgi:hypothetical protein